jgi:hypothetical protein
MAKTKSAIKDKTARIGGLPIRNLKKALVLNITENDCRKGNKKTPNSCAAALSAKRLPGVSEARIYLNRVMLKIGRVWYRGVTPKGLRTEIVSFDRGGKFHPGEFTIGAISPRLAKYISGKQQGTDKKTSNTMKHRAKNRRPKLRVLQSVRNNAHADYSYK